MRIRQSVPWQCSVSPLRCAAGHALARRLSRCRLSRCHCCAACGVGAAQAASSGFAKTSGGEEQTAKDRSRPGKPAISHTRRQTRRHIGAGQSRRRAMSCLALAARLSTPWGAEPIANHEHVVTDPTSIRREKRASEFALCCRLRGTMRSSGPGRYGQPLKRW
jgi:hypothetical protein